jgi:hypothetical protein
MGHAVGVFSNYADAERAVESLTRAGINRTDIGVVAAQSTVTEYAPAMAGADDHVVDGAGGGAVKGAIAGLLVGVSALALPGVGPLFVAGPIASVVTSTAAGATAGAVAGGMQSALAGIGIGEGDRDHYADTIERGGVLVSVHGPRADEARGLLKAAGATRVNEHAPHTTMP